MLPTLFVTYVVGYVYVNTLNMPFVLRQYGF